MGTGLISEKTETFYVELNKRAEAATRRSDQGVQFMNFSSQILIMVTEQLY